MIQSSFSRTLVLACCVFALPFGIGVAMATTLDPAAASAQRQQAMRNAPVDRIIVNYRSGRVTARDVGRTATTAITAAASRASIRLAPAARAGTTAAPTYLRTLAAGGELVKLPTRLSRADADRLVQELAADPAVESAQIDQRMYPLQTTGGALPNDPLLQTNQWHLIDPVGGINAAQAWATTQGEGVVVAVLDTGILPDHPDLAGNLLAGYDFITDPFVSRRATAERSPGALDRGDWIAEDGECGLFSLADDSTWHGTHVAGTVAEASNNGIGGAGVAYRAKVLPVRVLGHCGGYTSDIADAIVWASGGHVDGVPDNRDPAEVINISLGGGGACDSVTQAAINGAVSRGTTVVVAAGNGSSDVSTSNPANCANVIAVAATRSTGGLTDYSNFGRQVDLAGPGGSSMFFDTNDGPIRSFIWQTFYTGKTTPTSGQFTYGGTTFAGTSMASPHVAGTAALVQSALIADGKPPLSPAALEALLKRTVRAFPVPIPPATPAGTGIVDAGAAVARALRRCTPGDVGCQVDAQPLRNGVVQSGISNLAGDAGVFTFEASAGAVLSFISFGGSGQAALYVAFGREPSATDNDGASTRSGTSQTVRFTAPRAGTYILKLDGTEFDGVSLLARQ
ncbi:S8 family peptidase [Xanthomonas hortorum pv. vitians]|uniref:S8 family peptidase n=1 Tax=Xanthomonas hortorum pv. vitians TaxID=83224 RepID=A0AAW8ZKD1_9XANT|nr:S8 family peptidase [Xanthomonas hortorum]APP83527.1 protease [Xanthomonas hortorum pv. gardneri]ASW46567.1 protease [Xanthomonas hortorum]MCC8495058.1 S8 family serine peptidase [Xanthomonas hortorum pv. gardneri]MCE4280233.1 S8 family serine peptidase [Xanthomonas hortorum pv. vitians]MCE4284647.1 S8 family serine peptidase [Xanthomonas hortorum pv. vitians]